MIFLKAIWIIISTLSVVWIGAIFLKFFNKDRRSIFEIIKVNAFMSFMTGLIFWIPFLLMIRLLMN